MIPQLLRAIPGPTSPLVRMWCWYLHHPQGRPLPTSFPCSPLSVHQQPGTLQRSTPGYVVKMKYVSVGKCVTATKNVHYSCCLLTGHIFSTWNRLTRILLIFSLLPSSTSPFSSPHFPLSLTILFSFFSLSLYPSPTPLTPLFCSRPWSFWCPQAGRLEVYTHKPRKYFHGSTPQRDFSKEH